MVKFFSSVLFVASTMVFTVPALAVHMNLADQAIIDKDYATAIKEYKKAASVGNAKAFYQLSKIHHHGLGTPKNELRGILWMAVAAEYNYENSTSNLLNMKANLAPAKRDEVESIIKQFVKIYSKETIGNKYFPTLNSDAQSSSIVFEGGPHTDLALEQLDASDFNGLVDPTEDDISADDMGSDNLVDEVTQLAINLPYYSIAEYDIGPDGSIRDIQSIFRIGDDNYALDQLSISPVAKPIFAKKNVNFINRSILGIADTDTVSIRENNSELYSKTLRYAAKMKGSDSAINNYNHALALMHFPWLRVPEGTIDELLLKAAKQGFSLAQYEYALKLYRQQTSPEEAIYWLSEAAKQGLTKAEYRLARIILDSPWVEKDNNKAYFWLSQAALKKHTVAVRKLAEMKITDEDSKYYDPKGALVLLNTITAQQSEEPELMYLLALAYAKPENRQFPVAVTNLKKAITLAQSRHWDTSEWRNLLKKWTGSGTVTLNDL